MYFHTDEDVLLDWFERVVKRAKEDNISLRLDVTSQGGLRVKLGEGMWTAPFASTPDPQRDQLAEPVKMSLRTDTLYVIDEAYENDGQSNVTFGRTEDGVSMYWYGDEGEARGAVEPVVRTEMFDTHREFDEKFER